MSASLSVACNRTRPTTNQQVVLTITGTDTAWDATTRPTIAALNSTCGILSYTIDTVNQVITAVVNTGHGATTLTVGDSADAATDTLTVTAARKHRRGRARLDVPLRPMPVRMRA